MRVKCTNPIHGEPREWETKQTDETKIKCSKRGGAQGCGESQFVEVIRETVEKMGTGTTFNRFQERKEEILGRSRKEEVEKRAVIQSQKTVETGIGFLFSDALIRGFHNGIIDLIGSFLNAPVVLNQEMENELLLKAKEVLKMFTVETSPMQSYLITWGIVLIPALASKFFGGWFGSNDKLDEKIKE